MANKVVKHMKDVFIPAAFAMPVGGGIYWAADNTFYDYQKHYPSLSTEDADNLKNDIAKGLGGMVGASVFFTMLSGRQERRRSDQQKPKL